MALPVPQLGMVVSYGYLWRHEHSRGQEEGRKDRPCVIVLAAEQTDGGTVVTVVPITHTRPVNPAHSVDIPAVVKRHLNLDAAQSWAVLNEGNRFLWPGFDLRPIPGSADRFYYGFLPPNLFDALLRRFVAIWRDGQGQALVRD
jgi:mRNA-degrading endonuclease toxin of MazEF toxin-antitoxin module